MSNRKKPCCLHLQLSSTKNLNLFVTKNEKNALKLKQNAIKKKISENVCVQTNGRAKCVLVPSFSILKETLGFSLRNSHSSGCRRWPEGERERKKNNLQIIWKYSVSLSLAEGHWKNTQFHCIMVIISIKK